MGQRRLQRALASDVPFVGLPTADNVGEVVGQHSPQPGEVLCLAVAAELVALLVRFEQGPLHQVGRIDLAAEPRVEVAAGPEAQVVPEALRVVHAAPYK